MRCFINIAREHMLSQACSAHTLDGGERPVVSWNYVQGTQVELTYVAKAMGSDTSWMQAMLGQAHARWKALRNVRRDMRQMRVLVQRVVF